MIQFGSGQPNCRFHISIGMNHFSWSMKTIDLTPKHTEAMSTIGIFI